MEVGGAASIVGLEAIGFGHVTVMLPHMRVRLDRIDLVDGLQVGWG
jgi:hypothetical protein